MEGYVKQKHSKYFIYLFNVTHSYITNRMMAYLCACHAAHSELTGNMSSPSQ